MRVARTRGAGTLFVEYDGGAGTLLQRECGGNKNLSAEYGIANVYTIWDSRRDLSSGLKILSYILLNRTSSFTYDHRLQRKWDPVCSPGIKLWIGRLVVGWVTTSEYLLLYVYHLFGYLVFFAK
jgi:hypothetical protein